MSTLAMSKRSATDLLTAGSAARPDWVPAELFPFASHFVEVAGARLHYVDEGSGPTLQRSAVVSLIATWRNGSRPSCQADAVGSALVVYSFLSQSPGDLVLLDLILLPTDSPRARHSPRTPTARIAVGQANPALSQRA